MTWGYRYYGPMYDVIAISAGSNSFFIKSDGALQAWGGNWYNQCSFPGENIYQAISSSSYSSIALKADGTVITKGLDADQNEIPTSNDFVSAEVGNYSYYAWPWDDDLTNTTFFLALKENGSIAAWGDNSFGQCNVPGGISIRAITAGGNFGVAIAYDGSLITWGGNTLINDNVPQGNDFIAIDAGDSHCLALRSDGSIVAWGNNYYGQCEAPEGNNFIAISAGYGHSLAIKSNGTLVAWGNNQSGQCYVPIGNDFIAVSAGGNHSLALKSDGSVSAFGNNYTGNCGLPWNYMFTSAVSSGYRTYDWYFGSSTFFYKIVALRSDGALLGWDNNDYDIMIAENDFQQISLSAGYCLALKTDGSLLSLRNSDGQISTDTPSGNSFIAISAGSTNYDNEEDEYIRSYSLALKNDGTIVAWGNNDYGQCNVPTGITCRSISAGATHCLALKTDGSLVSWGASGSDLCNVPVGNDFIAVSAGPGYSLALKSNGKIIAWGSNNLGQCNVPTGYYYTAISAGVTHCLALKTDGSVVGWGDNTYGQCYAPLRYDYIAISAGYNVSCAIVRNNFVCNDDAAQTSEVIESCINAYPNPFRLFSGVTFDIDLKNKESGVFSIYNVKGQKVTSFNVNSTKQKYVWNGKDVNNRFCSTGVYFYRLVTNRQHETKKLLIIK